MKYDGLRFIDKIRKLYQPNEILPVIRKSSVIAHWFLGALCAYLMLDSPPVALTIMGMFGGMEAWNDYNEGKGWGDGCGCTDFWDCFVVFIVGISIIQLLRGLKVM